MPDKDFDNLFRDKFVDAEIEPSANLWAKIEDKLEPKRKHILPIYWMAAASIAIAFTALLVFQKTDRIQLHPDETTAAITNSVEQSEPPAIDEATSTQPNKIAGATFAKTEVNGKGSKIIHAISETNLENNKVALQPNETTDRLDIKRADPRPIDVLPIKETPVENPIVIASNADAQQKIENNVITETDNLTERKGIRNVGDLVNYVVDKVDKRDKKLVRFNTDDDDNSSIVGINIGFLKFNKKNR